MSNLLYATAVKNDNTWRWFQSQAEAIRAVFVIDNLVNPLSMTLRFLNDTDILLGVKFILDAML